MTATLFWRWGLASIFVLALGVFMLIDMISSVKPMTAEEEGAIHRILCPLGIDSTAVRWKWLVGWRAEYGTSRGLCASYRCVSNSIAIPIQYRGLVCDPVLLPTYAHELCHAKQRKKLGLVLYLWVKTFSRQVLEDEATIAEMNALDIVTRPINAVQ